MRAYTLSILSRLANSGNPIVEKEIVQWVNNKLTEAGKESVLKHFNDPAIADAKIVIDLVDALKAGSINYELVKTSGTEEFFFGAFGKMFERQYTCIVSVTVCDGCDKCKLEEVIASKDLKSSPGSPAFQILVFPEIEIS
ncbi:Plastin-3 [Eumeta japonica]|uniref:Plastin-3 n=1 Tax=Eumeta variegata TaxID=151549 RepID=A0A4C1T128_EUMVA|nr:Plastin-3 [Eumeta japonica]